MFGYDKSKYQFNGSHQFSYLYLDENKKEEQPKLRHSFKAHHGINDNLEDHKKSKQYPISRAIAFTYFFVVSYFLALDQITLLTILYIDWFIGLNFFYPLMK